MDIPNREKLVEFDNVAHHYRILSDPSHEYISVTTWLGTFFEPFDADKIIGRMRASRYWEKSKYYGMSDAEIKEQWETNRNEASSKGTAIHDDIDAEAQKVLLPFATSNQQREGERKVDKTDPSWKIYERFCAEHPTWKLVKSEWRIFDEDCKVAGTIDALYQNEAGEYILVDWKRCKKLNRETQGYDYATPWPICQLLNTNYHHYTLQLNIYRFIIERHYGIKISRLVLAVLHPDYKPDHERWLEVADLQLAIGVLAEHRKFQVSAR